MRLIDLCTKTKEYEDEELNSSSSWPWGPLTLEQKKFMMTRSQALRHLVPGTYIIGTKKCMMTRSRTPHHCALE